MSSIFCQTIKQLFIMCAACEILCTAGNYDLYPGVKLGFVMWGGGGAL